VHTKCSPAFPCIRNVGGGCHGGVDGYNLAIVCSLSTEVSRNSESEAGEESQFCCCAASIGAIVSLKKITIIWGRREWALIRKLRSQSDDNSENGRFGVGL